MILTRPIYLQYIIKHKGDIVILHCSFYSTKTKCQGYTFIKKIIKYIVDVILCANKSLIIDCF